VTAFIIISASLPHNLLIEALLRFTFFSPVQQFYPGGADAVLQH
jgi:hypothetical protein